ncbi:MAG: MFS transporter [Rhodobacteraceae bacterium]|nr:MFS transporter [Paracoccaceae bacterium]
MAAPGAGGGGRLPGGIVALGFVSLFMDVSSEMVHALLPVFVTVTLGASPAVLGLIEGLGEATAQIVKVFSGTWSDRMRRRKPLAVAGYLLAALTKPVFAIAGSAGVVLAARLADRLGKGIRGAPRDALVADLAPADRQGAAFGLRQSMDTVGAFTGPLLAILVMTLSGGDIRLVFALAVIPAALSVFILWRFVSEPPPRPRQPGPSGAPAPAVRLDRATLSRLGPGVWRVTALGAILAFARFSEAFLVLRATGAGLALAWAPLVLVLLNLVYAATAWPVGVLSDRIGKRGLLALGLAALVLAQAALAGLPGLGGAFAGIALWGLHLGLTQGLLSAEVARAAPLPLRGTAFGVFNLASGAMMLAGNLAAGLVWAVLGGTATFWLGALAALGGLLAVYGLAAPPPPGPAPRSGPRTGA